MAGVRKVARATTDDWLTTDEEKANAHLIAAAPELYEALLAVKNSPVGGSGQLIIANSLWDQIGNALAKARGENQ